MADPFSIATGALQVASVGAKLTTTLYTFAETAWSADRRIAAIAKDISITSSVLQQLANLLRQAEANKLCTPEYLYTARMALEGCDDAFKLVARTFGRSSDSGNYPQRKLSLGDRLRWPLKQTKVSILQSNLDRLKTNLSLMVSVLTYAKSAMSDSLHKPTVPCQTDRVHIERLIEANITATHRYDRLIASLQRGGVLSLTSEEASKKNPPPDGLCSSSWHSSLTSSCLPPSKRPPEHSCKSPLRYRASAEDPLFSKFVDCAAAAFRLTTSIDAASCEWRSGEGFAKGEIVISFETVNLQLLELYSLAAKLEHPSGLPIDSQRSAAQLGSTQSQSETFPSTFSPDYLRFQAQYSPPRIHRHRRTVNQFSPSDVEHLSNPNNEAAPSSPTEDTTLSQQHSLPSTSSRRRHRRERSELVSPYRPQTRRRVGYETEKVDTESLLTEQMQDALLSCESSRSKQLLTTACDIRNILVQPGRLVQSFSSYFEHFSKGRTTKKSVVDPVDELLGRWVKARAI